MSKRAIAIYPDKRLQELDIDDLKDMQAVVQGLIEPVTLRDGSTMYVNEEGLYQFGPEDVNWTAADVAGLGGRPEFMFGRPALLGPVLFVGPVDEEGNDTDVTDTVRRWVRRVAQEAGAEWIGEKE